MRADEPQIANRPADCKPQVVTALFVETDGCYFGLPDVDPWDKHRDGRFYEGPYPVVAHPPCERWGRYAKGSPLKQSFTPGDDDGCFRAALRAVSRFGGVIEHPADSRAWWAFRLPLPPRAGWRFFAPWWVCQVEQGHYGHPARKKTWLLYQGIGKPPLDLIWGPSPQRLPLKRLRERGYESARKCGAVGNLSHNQRQRTPPAFRDLLLSIARRARP